MSKFGRKLTMISMSIPCTIGWILLLLPVPLEMENGSLFLVGRFLTGKLRKNVLPAHLIFVYIRQSKC
jgi:hypothetical protein